MFAVGHLSLGHLLGFASSRSLKIRMNIPLILTLSIIPDIDLIIPRLAHRGPTHSIIAATLLFIPLFIMYKKRATAYYVAVIQHSLIGDFIPGGRIQLLWPLTNQYYGIELGIRSLMNITAEWVLFIISIIIMIRTKQITRLLQPHPSNLLLTIPAATALLPTFLGFPLEIPTSLILPHLAYLGLFAASFLIDITQQTRKQQQKEQGFPCL